jgi:hypothetical protein
MTSQSRDEIDWSSVRHCLILPARGMWPDEVRDLTPWVIANLDALGEKIGMTLEYVGREVPVGGFRADIVARDGAGRTVIIENQFGPTDHEHFGQVVLYACEARADVVVWLAAGGSWGVPQAVRLEHRRALARLNEVFAGQIAFFGVEVEIRSDDQPFGEPDGPAVPRLDVVVRPDGPR